MEENDPLRELKDDTAMKKLLIYMKGYGKESVLGPLFKLLEASFELLVPLVMAAIIDTGVAGADRGYILRMGGVLLLLGLVGLAASITAQYFSAKAAVGFAGRLRHALFEKVESLSFTQLDMLGASTVITRMTSDVNQVQTGVNLALRLLLRSPFIVFGAMAMAFTIDTKSALVFLAVIPLLALVVFGVMLWTIPQYRRVQAELDGVLGKTRETLTGARVLRAFAREEEETAAFRKKNAALARMQRFVGRISALMNPLTYAIINLAVLVLLHTGALQVDAGRITQGELVALVNYMSQILVELIKLANLIITITRALASANRVAAVLSLPSGNAAMAKASAPLPAAPAGVPAVEFDGVSLSYENAGAESLSDVSFRAYPGETIGVIGGTGSGKSSLVNLIPGFYPATRGSVRVFGTDVKDWPVAALRGKIGIVPQKAVLFKGTIRENLRWGRSDAEDDALWDALASAQAKEFVEQKEGGLSAPVEQNGRNFSGGQKQRLTIARALVRKPEILILDDSASALDYATDAKLRRAIRAMEGGPTVFLVSQRAASIRHADKIIVLDDGQVAGIGTHEALLQGCSVYQEIYYSQFPKEAAAPAGKEA